MIRHGMPLACAGAMAAGLMVDTAQVHPEALAALCASATSLLDSWAVHRRAMPATTLFMLAAPAVMLATMAMDQRRVAAETIGQAVMWLLTLMLVPAGTSWAARHGVSGFGVMVVAMAAAVLAGWVAATRLARVKLRATRLSRPTH